MSTLGVAGVDESATADAMPPDARGPRAPVAWAVERLRAPSGFDGIFTPLQRRIGLIWACLAVPFMAVFGLFANTPDSYVFVWVFFASGAFTLPALVVSVLGWKRGSEADRRSYVMISAGLVLIFGTGVAMLVHLATGWTVANAVGVPCVLAIAATVITGVVRLVRNRSGARALSVDLIESVMSVLVVIAPAALIWGERVADAEDAWFAIPSAIAVVCTVYATYWAVVFYVRVRPEAGMLEGIGIALALGGVANSAAQTAQGITGFTLPAPPLVVLHALCMSQLLLIPLFLRRLERRGLDRLPPQAQVRGGGLVAALTLAGLPVLLVTTVLLADDRAWTVPFSLAVMTLLLMLAAVRHLLNVRETRRLYGHLESASEERRALLAQVMQRADDDRHRVAAELHEQAVSAYASFVSFIQAVGTPTSGPTSALAGASTLVRDDLARHADSLRHLMLAIKPLEPEGGAQTLAAPIHAYVDNLYGDRPAPALQVSVADGVVLDWISETIALRIVQEALRNVYRHSRATRVDVTIGAGDSGVVEVRVVDNGVGFDPATTMFESGIAAMRSFAGVVEGRVLVDSAPGVGTSVVATLGDVGEDAPGGPAAPTDGRAPGAPPRLRLVQGQARD